LRAAAAIAEIRLDAFDALLKFPDLMGFESQAGRAAAKMLTKDEPRRIAADNTAIQATGGL
jgi:hypothetical protein